MYNLGLGKMNACKYALLLLLLLQLSIHTCALFERQTISLSLPSCKTKNNIFQKVNGL